MIMIMFFIMIIVIYSSYTAVLLFKAYWIEVDRETFNSSVINTTNAKGNARTSSIAIIP